MSKIEKRPMKAYVRFDGTGRIVPSSLILRRKKPKVGKWMEVPAYECCNPTTTSTTTETPSTTTSTTTACLSTIYVDNGSSGSGYGGLCQPSNITGVSINGIPVTVTSGSFPLNFGQSLTATTNQSGSVLVEVQGNYFGSGGDSNPWMEAFGCNSNQANYNIQDSGGTTSFTLNISCDCLYAGGYPYPTPPSPVSLALFAGCV
jgi:hypothetical protein